MRLPDDGPRTPWRGIRASLVVLREERLSYSAANVSPCLSCPTTPCCSYLPLHSFRVQNLRDLDHAIYVLNFAHIELGLTATGDWTVYYRYPCRFLKRDTFGCSLHDTAEQPRICANYNPYACWYKKTFTRTHTPEHLRIDRRRMAVIVEHIEFDQQRNITRVPDWESLSAAMAEIAEEPFEDDPDPPEPALGEPAIDAWRTAITTPQVEPAAGAAAGYDNAHDPCDGCGADCCRTLLFPHPPAASRAALDFLKFCLGFPGVEISVTDEGWSLAVRTSCRHLRENRCSIFGAPDRPQICRYYDAWRCTYKPRYGGPPPSGFLRIRYDQFRWLSECYEFDEAGSALAVPRVEALRRHIETRWREEMRGPA